jgi:hypothetical protein
VPYGRSAGCIGVVGDLYRVLLGRIRTAGR